MTVKDVKITRLKGANMDINLTADPKKIHWKQDECPWNKEEKTKKHRCALRNISICKNFKGIAYPDIVLCAYKNK